jgi:hypothetical protein
VGPPQGGAGAKGAVLDSGVTTQMRRSFQTFSPEVIQDKSCL